MAELTNEARQCLGGHTGRDGIAPWTGVNNWYEDALLSGKGSFWFE